HLQLAVPVSITVDKEGRVYVLDSLRHCITIFNEEGQPIGECGGQGRSPGWFYFPKSIARDAKGRFYVCDTALKRVQVFTIPVEELEKPREAKGK
ncbi:MAG: hypothetical protein HYY16_08675, partial [Planctomycetes bacterium]|nr:hypothetical protein [Planctomycetota bacterium]